MPIFKWDNAQTRRWTISWLLILILMIATTIKLSRESRMEPDEKTIMNVRRLSLIMTVGALFLVIYFNFSKRFIKGSKSDSSTSTDWKYTNFNFDPEKQDTGENPE